MVPEPAPVATPVVEPVGEVAEPAPEPAAEPAPEPALESVLEPRPVVETEPVVETGPEPVVETVEPEPVVEVEVIMVESSSEDVAQVPDVDPSPVEPTSETDCVAAEPPDELFATDGADPAEFASPILVQDEAAPADATMR
jgi:hypothetical protein